MTLRIFADANNCSEDGMLRLGVVGALRDIELHKNVLVPGLRVTFYDGQYEMEGVLEFDEERNIWLGKPEWGTFREV